MFKLVGVDEVLLCILCLGSAMGTMYVQLSIKTSQFQTSSSLLVMYANNGLTCLTISTVPRFFQEVPSGCLVSSVLFFYGYFQMLLVCYLCLKFTNHSLLMSALHNMRKRSDFTLGWGMKLAVGVLPFLPNVLVLVTSPTENRFVWCSVPFDTLNGYYVHVQFFICTALLYVFIFGELYAISCDLQKRTSRDNFIHFQENILYEPAVYSAVTLVAIIFSTLVVFMDYDQSNYTLRYAQTVCIYILGFTYLGIFIKQRPSLLAFERLYADISGFGGNIYSDDFGECGSTASMITANTVASSRSSQLRRPGTCFNCNNCCELLSCVPNNVLSHTIYIYVYLPGYTSLEGSLADATHDPSPAGAQTRYAFLCLRTYMLNNIIYYVLH